MRNFMGQFSFWLVSMKRLKLCRGILVVGLLVQCVLAGAAGAASPPTGATTCAIPYTFVVQGRTIYAGSCAGRLPARPPAITVPVGTRFRVRILHERNGALDYPIPVPSNTSVHRTRRRGATVYYRTAKVGTTRLIAGHPPFCPKIGNCAVLAVHVVPVTLHLRWRLVATKVAYAAGSDRYAAIIEYGAPGTASSIILVDEQQSVRETITPSGCPQALSTMFGGGYLLVVCSYGSYQLFNIASGQWVAVSPSCPSGWFCQPAGIGRYWLKLAGVPECEHCTRSDLLQDLSTGAVKQDPAAPGGRIYDDLNTPSGSRPLCSPLRYPSDTGLPAASAPGVTFEGPFALTIGNHYTIREGLTPVYGLRRCGSPMDLQIPPDNPPTPLISSGAVVWQNGATRLAGRYLPSLRPFTAVGAPLPQNPYGRILLAALTRRTIYMLADSGELWAATLP